MKRKSVKYDTAKSGGWTNKSDDLFLAQYRGKPCEICGRRGGYDNGRKMPSAGHHLIFKGRCRKHRYNHKNIIVLCPHHHSHYADDCSPHSITSTHAQHVFEEWVRVNKPEQYAWWMEHMPDMHKVYNDPMTPREWYVELGGEIANMDKPMKHWRPLRHKPKVDALVELNRQNGEG